MNVEFNMGKHGNVTVTNLKEVDPTDGMSDEELFSEVNHNDLESEKITAPRYSYWHSVFRVFFKKKINIVMLGLLAFIVAMAYLYPMFLLPLSSAADTVPTGTESIIMANAIITAQRNFAPDLFDFFIVQHLFLPLFFA